MLQNSAKTKPLKKTEKNKNCPIPYKGATIGSYPQLPGYLPHPRPLPRIVVAGFCELSSGRCPSDLLVNQDYQPVYRKSGLVITDEGLVSSLSLLQLPNLSLDPFYCCSLDFVSR
jgi:hypothetical protein